MLRWWNAWELRNFDFSSTATEAKVRTATGGWTQSADPNSTGGVQFGIQHGRDSINYARSTANDNLFWDFLTALRWRLSLNSSALIPVLALRWATKLALKSTPSSEALREGSWRIICSFPSWAATGAIVPEQVELHVCEAGGRWLCCEEADAGRFAALLMHQSLHQHEVSSNFSMPKEELEKHNGLSVLSLWVVEHCGARHQSTRRTFFKPCWLGLHLKRFSKIYFIYEECRGRVEDAFETYWHHREAKAQRARTPRVRLLVSGHWKAFSDFFNISDSSLAGGARRLSWDGSQVQKLEGAPVFGPASHLNSDGNSRRYIHVSSHHRFYIWCSGTYVLDSRCFSDGIIIASSAVPTQLWNEGSRRCTCSAKRRVARTPGSEAKADLTDKMIGRLHDTTQVNRIDKMMVMIHDACLNVNKRPFLCSSYNCQVSEGHYLSRVGYSAWQFVGSHVPQVSLRVLEETNMKVEKLQPVCANVPYIGCAMHVAFCSRKPEALNMTWHIVEFDNHHYCMTNLPRKLFWMGFTWISRMYLFAAKSWLLACTSFLPFQARSLEVVAHRQRFAPLRGGLESDGGVVVAVDGLLGVLKSSC